VKFTSFFLNAVILSDMKLLGISKYIISVSKRSGQLKSGISGNGRFLIDVEAKDTIA